LSRALQEELEFEDKGRILYDIPVIKKYFSPKAIRKLSLEMEEIHYSPGDAIQNGNEKALIYIYRGRIRYLTDRNRQSEGHVRSIEESGERSFFGLEALLGGNAVGC
jgi:hypothetical protein